MSEENNSNNNNTIPPTVFVTSANIEVDLNSLDPEVVNNLDVVSLREICHKLGLVQKGNKPSLAKRILRA